CVLQGSAGGRGRVQIQLRPIAATTGGNRPHGHGESRKPARALTRNAAVAARLPFRLIARCSRQVRIGLPKRGWASSQRSNAGWRRPKAKAASSRNGTFGSNGRNAPTAPRTSETAPTEK